MKRALVGAVCLLVTWLLGLSAATAESFANQAPAAPLLSNIDTASCGTGHAVVAATKSVYVTTSVTDPDNQSVAVTLQLFTADHSQQLGQIRRTIDTGTTVIYKLPSSTSLRSGQQYAIRAIAYDGQRRSDPSSWCRFLVDNRVPSAPKQDTTSFGTTVPMGFVGQRGQITVSGGGAAAAQYQWTAESDFVFIEGCADYATFGTDCTTRGDPVTFNFKPKTTSFQICVRAVSRAGLLSDNACQTYQVNPAG